MIALLALAGFISVLVGPELWRNFNGSDSVIVSNTGVFEQLADGTIALVPSVAQALLTSIRASGGVISITTLGTSWLPLVGGPTTRMILRNPLTQNPFAFADSDPVPAAPVLLNLHFTYDLWISTAVIMGQPAQVIATLAHQIPSLVSGQDPPMATSLNQATDMTKACMVLFSTPGSLLS